MFDIATPSYIKIGRGSLSELGSTLRNYHIENPLIITDSFLASSALIEKVTASLGKYDVFSGVGPDPDISMINEGLEQFIYGKHDGLIGFGGGSSMDAAKLINLAHNCKGDFLSWRVPKSPAMPTSPLACIPTTAGTGSEVTRGAVVTNPSNQEKVVFMGPACLADIAVIDPDLIDELPGRIAAETGLDALTHALEAYVSRKNNSYTETMAKLSLSLTGNSLEAACLQNDPKAREAMMLGAMYAGMAFSNSSVAMIHGMARPIGSFFHIPHGLSIAMLLPQITEFSIDGAPDKYAEISKICGFSSSEDDVKTACSCLTEGLKDLCARLQVSSLSQFGVDKDMYFTSINTMAEQALASGSPANNPRIPELEDIVKLYESTWK